MGLAGAPAAGAAGPADYAFSFSATRPATPTGIGIHVLYRNPDDPDGKAPQITKGEFALPPGTRIDTNALTQCTATDAELRARGRDACPEESRIGEGYLVATTGTPADPQRTDVTVFNGRNELIELVTFAGTNQTAGFDRLSVEGSTLKAHPPTTPGGPPDGRTTVREIRITIKASGRLFVTPSSCPGNALWRSVGTFGFDGYQGDVVVPATTRCDPTAASTLGDPTDGRATGDGGASSSRAASRALHVRVLPRRVRRGSRSRVRVVVTSATPGCARGATVRIGRARARTDARGRATLRVRVRRTARVRVTKRGCGPGRARLSVR
jgi:hypothetical protein